MVRSRVEHNICLGLNADQSRTPPPHRPTSTWVYVSTSSRLGRLPLHPAGVPVPVSGEVGGTRPSGGVGGVLYLYTRRELLYLWVARLEVHGRVEVWGACYTFTPGGSSCTCEWRGWRHTAEWRCGGRALPHVHPNVARTTWLIKGPSQN